MSSSNKNSPQAISTNTVQVFLGSLVQYGDLASSVLAAPLLATGGIGLDSMGYELTTMVLDHDPGLANLASTWAGSGSGTQEESEASGLTTGTVTLSNNSGSTIYVPVEGATVSTVGGLTYTVIGDIHSGNWIQGSNADSLGSYVVAPDATITVPVAATGFGPAYAVAANAISSVSVGGLSVTSSSSMVGDTSITNPSANNQDGFLSTTFSQYTTIFGAGGLYPSESHVNVDESHEWQPLEVASWEGYVDNSRSVGILNVAPILTDNDYTNDLQQPFATGAWFAGMRQAALYSGGIAFDVPPNYFLARTWDAYGENLAEMIRWCEQNGLRSSMVISPGNNVGYDPDWASNTLQMLTWLKSQNAMPDQIDIENYRPQSTNLYDGSYVDPNSINALALQVEQLGLNAPTPSEDGLELRGTSAAQTDVIMTGVQQTQNYQTAGAFNPFATTQVFDEVPGATISIKVGDTSSLLALADGFDGSSVAAGGTLAFTGTASDVTKFLQSLVATASSGASGVAQLGLAITDQAGNVTQATSPIDVGVLAPVITGISSSATSSGYLRANDVMTWTVKLSEMVSVTGKPTLLLSNEQQATYQGQDSSGDLVFTYTVWQNMSGTDVMARALMPNGATFLNSSGYALDVDSLDPYLATQTGFEIQTNPTFITTVTEGGVAPDPAGGSMLAFTLGSGSALSVIGSGNPTVTMSDGGTAIFAGVTANGQLAFTYNLPVGTLGAVAPATLNLNDTTVQDANGYWLWSSIPASVAVAPVAVDTTGPLILPGASLSSDHVQLVVDEDQWSGNAMFSVTVDGKTLPGTFTTSASHAAGQRQTIDIYGNFGGSSTPTTVGVSFLNAGWGGTVSTERNLYVQSIGYDGSTTTLAQELTGWVSTVTATPMAPNIVGLTSSATQSGYLRAGAVITWNLRLDQPVTVSGTPTLLLSDQQQASYSGQDADGDLLFSFKVWQNESDPAFQVAALQLNGATIAGAQGQSLNVGSLDPYLASQTTYDIQTNPIFVTSVSSAGIASDPTGGFQYMFSLGAAAPLRMLPGGGVPTVTMSDGGTASFAGMNAQGQLVFAYSIPQGGKGTIAPSNLNLNGASLVDPTGHWLWSSIPSSVAVTPVPVDTTGPLILPGASLSSDHVQLVVDEDQWSGNAMFSVTVDGKTLPETFTTSASHAAGQRQTIDIYGNFGGSSTPATVGVTFLNAGWGGTVSTERNLYVQSIGYDGASTTLAQELTGWNSTASTTIQPSVDPDVIKVFLSEDAFNGDAQAAITVDGKVAIADATVTASHAAGAIQEFDISGGFGGVSGTNTIGVTFLNDAWGGNAAADRNLYVDGVVYDGGLTNASTLLPCTGSTSVSTIHGAGDNLVLFLSEDAWQGDAQCRFTVDGNAVGAVQSINASHAAGAEDVVVLSGHWGSGVHSIGMTFLNPGGGGTPTSTRAVHLDGAAYDGKSVNVSTTITGSSPAFFSTALARAATGIAGSMLAQVLSKATAPAPAALVYAAGRPLTSAALAAAMHTVAPASVSIFTAPPH